MRAKQHCVTRHTALCHRQGQTALCHRQGVWCVQKRRLVKPGHHQSSDEQPRSSAEQERHVVSHVSLCVVSHVSLCVDINSIPVCLEMSLKQRLYVCVYSLSQWRKAVNPNTHDILTRNWYQKTGTSCRIFGTRFWYQKQTWLTTQTK